MGWILTVLEADSRDNNHILSLGEKVSPRGFTSLKMLDVVLNVEKSLSMNFIMYFRDMF